MLQTGLGSSVLASIGKRPGRLWGMTILLELTGIHISPPTLHPRLKQLRPSLPTLSPPWTCGDSSQLVESVAGAGHIVAGSGLGAD